MQGSKRWTVSVSVLLGAVLLAACQPDTPKLTEQEHQTMNAMTKNTTPRCIGRYMLDLPDGFVLNSESSTTVDEVKIDVKPMPEVIFKAALEDHEAALRRQHMDGRPTVPLLKKIEPSPQVAFGKIFNRAESSGMADYGRALELWAWRDGYAIRLTAKARDMTLVDESDRPDGDTRRTNTNEKLSLLLDLYARIRGRQDSEVPTEQGLCIPNGFVKGPAGDGEEVLFFYHLKGANDIYFRFETASTYHEDTSLLDRSKQIEGSLAEAKGKTVRKGRKEAHGISYDEWLATGQTTDNVRGQLFSFEANSKAGTAKAPIILFTLYNGYRIPAPERTLEQSAVLPPITKATLSEAESLTLWDAAIPTLRPRPGAF